MLMRAAIRNLLAGLFALLAASAILSAEGTPSVPLGEGDRLNLRIFGQENLSGIYRIGPGGELVIPGLGLVEGPKSFGEMRAAVQALIDKNLGLPETAFSLTVEEWRPIVVGGYVAEPGARPYRPGLRAAHAIALAGGWRIRQGDALTQVIQINQERERLAQARTRLAKALITRARLDAELAGEAPSEAPPPEAVALAGEARARALAATEREIAETRRRSFELARKRIGAALDINTEDIAAQKALTSSLKTQLELVRGDLERLKPLIETGSITGARILALRRDFVEIEGRVGEAEASLAKARTGRVVLEEERNVLALQIRLDRLSERAANALEILEARATIDSITDTLEKIGESPLAIGAGRREGDCRLVILRQQPGSDAPAMIEADAMTPLLPGDLLQVGRKHKSCPEILLMNGISR